MSVRRGTNWNIPWLQIETKCYAICGKAFQLLNMPCVRNFVIGVMKSLTGSNLKEEGKKGRAEGEAHGCGG